MMMMMMIVVIKIIINAFEPNHVKNMCQSVTKREIPSPVCHF